MASKSARKRRKRRPPARVKPPEDSAAPQPPPSGAIVAPARAPRRRGTEEPPQAPWGSFPLIELAVLIGVVMLILGFFVVGGTRGAILIGFGLLLGSIGGLELSIREHFAGYQSHTAVLAGVPAALTLGLLFYLGPGGLPPLARAAIGVAVFAAAALLLTRAFSRRSGGDRFRFRPLS